MTFVRSAASLLIVWSVNVGAQVAPGTIPEVPLSPAQGDGVQRQQRPADDLKRTTPPPDTAKRGASPEISRPDPMRSRDRTFDGMNKPPAPNGTPTPVPGAPMSDPASRPAATDPARGLPPAVPAQPVPGKPLPGKPMPQPGDRG